MRRLVALDPNVYVDKVDFFETAPWIPRPLLPLPRFTHSSMRRLVALNPNVFVDVVDFFVMAP